MAFALAVAIVGIFALVTGGKIQNIKNIQFRYSWLVFVAVIIKIITNSDLRFILAIPDWLAPKLYIISLILVAVFVLFNIYLRGLVLVGLGLVSNLTAIFFNSGYMPVKSEYFNIIASAEELERINQGLTAFNYLPTGPSTKFYYLSDIFLMPHWVFMTKVFSIGDVLITIGGAIFVWTSIRTTQVKKAV